MSLRFKILTAVVLVMLAVMTLLVINITIGTYRQKEDSERMRLRWVRRVVADLLEGRTMVEQHEHEILQYVLPLKRARLVSGYALVAADGTIRDRYDEMTSWPRPALVEEALRENRIVSEGRHVVVPIQIVGIDRWGTLQIYLSVPTQLTYTGTDLFLNVFGSMLVGSLVLLLVLYILIRKMVLQPLEVLARHADRLAAGKLEVEIAFTDRPDEIGQLIRAFRSMRLRLANYYHKLQEEIDAARAKIKKQERGLMVAQRLAATGTLAAGIAHEVNNPIGGMLNASLSLKKRHAEDARTVRYLDLIIEGLDRVRETVSKVLQFTPRGVSVGPVGIRRAVDSALGLATHRLKRNEVEVTVDVAEDLPPVRGNLAELQQVILNMLFNAGDAIEEPPGTIAIAARVAEGRLRLTIADSGCGMTEEELSQAFDLFHTTKDPGKGTGLGLSIAHNIITGHDGTIELESAKGEGTTVIITLPLYEEPEESRRISAESLAARP